MAPAPGKRHFEKWGRNPVPITETIKNTAAKSLPKAVFKVPPKFHHSLGELFDELSKPGGWNPANPISRQLGYLSWASFVFDQGSWNEIMRSWRCLLSVKHQLLI